ncbi:MAG: response regulator [Elusimicrobia bacterium]|nr:response regulator [Elusimicrobiota bacterium]
MGKNKSIFTTQEVAELLSCDLTTVIKWVNSGKLNAYKTPGGHRRIEKSELLKFIKKYNLPFPEELKEENRILIVDDDPEFVEIARGYLKEIKDAKIEVASDGFSAGEKVISFKPHLVILDIKLPGLDGFEVCRNIKSDENTSQIKIIAVTAYDSPQDKKKILESGADHYFSKPLERGKFLNTVEKLLS